MKLQTNSPDELLAKAYQCQADADAIEQIIVHLEMLCSELTTGFGRMDEQLQIERLEASTRHLAESADHMRHIADLLHQLLTPIGPGSRIEDIAAAFKD